MGNSLPVLNFLPAVLLTHVWLNSFRQQLIHLLITFFVFRMKTKIPNEYDQIFLLFVRLQTFDIRLKRSGGTVFG